MYMGGLYIHTFTFSFLSLTGSKGNLLQYSRYPGDISLATTFYKLTRLAGPQPPLPLVYDEDFHNKSFSGVPVVIILYFCLL